ncbi:hypothetical protein ACIO3O_08240 [Streptomyces sp. NPDC087440]|uniref:hypothetical protein n=1 Tax=Streptomyces sp. NPDC087440 TaxID=3365790 RepID=UPI00381FA107
MYDALEDVVGVLTEQIERRFSMGMAELKMTVAAAPDANSEATSFVRWHDLLTESQTALGKAEDDLLASLETQPSEVDDPTLALAFRVNDAVAARDARAMVIRWMLDPTAVGLQGRDAARRTLLSGAGRRGPAVPTSPPAARPVTAPATGRGASR